MLVKLAAIFFSMILVNNYVLVKFYGICPFLGVSKKLDSSVGMSGAVIFVMFMATAVTFPIQIFILDVAALGFAAAYIEALVCSIGAGVGFMLAMVMFSGVRKRVEACDPPAPFKGLPITLIAAAITSLSFMGFGGIVENLFNVTL